MLWRPSCVCGRGVVAAVAIVVVTCVLGAVPGTAQSCALYATDYAGRIPVSSLAFASSFPLSSSSSDPLAFSGAFRTVELGDFDGDGYDDIVVSDRDLDKVYWYPNDKKGGFTGAGARPVLAGVPAAQDVSQVTVGDIDGDGDVDVPVAIRGDNSGAARVVWVENSDGAGTFTTVHLVRAGTESYAVYAHDMDGDGDLDLVLALGSAAVVRVYTNVNSLGTSWSSTNAMVGVQYVDNTAVADFDHSGTLDVACMAWRYQASLSYALQGAGGSWGPTVDLVVQPAVDGGSSSAAGDIDGDGWADLVACSSIGGTRLILYRNVFATGGTFVEEADIASSTGRVERISLVDIDGDGHVDVVTSGPNRASLFHSNGDLTFSVSSVFTAHQTGVYAHAVGRIDVDERVDVVFAGANGIRAYASQDAVTPAPAVLGATGGAAVATSVLLALGPFNAGPGPGASAFSDVIVLDRTNGEAFVIGNPRDGGESLDVAGARSVLGPSSSLVSNTAAVAAYDLNGDGYADALFATSTGVYYALSTGPVSAFSAPVVITSAISVAAGTSASVVAFPAASGFVVASNGTLAYIQVTAPTPTFGAPIALSGSTGPQIMAVGGALFASSVSDLVVATSAASAVLSFHGEVAVGGTPASSGVIGTFPSAIVAIDVYPEAGVGVAAASTGLVKVFTPLDDLGISFEEATVHTAGAGVGVVRVVVADVDSDGFAPDVVVSSDDGSVVVLRRMSEPALWLPSAAVGPVLSSALLIDVVGVFVATSNSLSLVAASQTYAAALSATGVGLAVVRIGERDVTFGKPVDVLASTAVIPGTGPTTWGKVYGAMAGSAPFLLSESTSTSPPVHDVWTSESATESGVGVLSMTSRAQVELADPPASTEAWQLEHVVLVDITLDGATDVVFAHGWASPAGHELSIAYAASLDSQGAFAPLQKAVLDPINSGGASVVAIAAGDVDGDGDVDVVAASSESPPRVFVVENTGAQRWANASAPDECGVLFGTSCTISPGTGAATSLATSSDSLLALATSFTLPGAVSAVKAAAFVLESDGTISAVLAVYVPGVPGLQLSALDLGTGSLTPPAGDAQAVVIPGGTAWSGLPVRMRAARLSASASDVVLWSQAASTSVSSPVVAAIRAAGGSFNVSSASVAAVVSTPGAGEARGISSVATADVDGDGDNDVLFASTAGIGVVLNLGVASGLFGHEHVVSAGDNGFGVALFVDLDGGNVAPDVIGAWPASAGMPGVFGYGLERGTAVRAMPAPLVVDVAACGYTMACVGQALAAVSHCSPLRVPTTLQHVVVPPGRYTGCFDTGIAIRKSTRLRASGGPGSVTFDCAAGGGGVLFDVATPGVTLAVEDIDVVGASARPTVKGTTGLRVEGIGATLRLTRVTLVNCSSVADVLSAQVQFAQGFGGAVLVVAGGSLVAEDVVFAGNTAGTSGGAVAVLSTGSSAVFTRCVFRSNVAAGAGGAVYAAAGSPRVVIGPGSVLEGNSAALAGGAVFVVLAQSETVGAGLAAVQLGPDVHVVGNSAEWGGAVGATRFAESLFFPQPGSTPAVLPPSSGVLALNASRAEASYAVAADGVRFADNSAAYGGVFFVCDAYVRVGWANASTHASTGNKAEVSGDLGFGCLPHGVVFPPFSGDDAAFLAAGGGGESGGRALPWLELSGATGGASWLTGLSFATPPAQLQITEAPPTSVPSGVPLGSGTFAALDALGTPLVDSRLQVSLVLSVEAGSAAAAAFGGSGSRTVDLGDGTASFGEVAVLGREPDDLGVPLSLLWLVEDAINSRPGSLLQPLATSLTLLECPPNFGRSSVEGEPIRCAECAGSSISLETSIEPCLAPLVCPSGSVARDGECVFCPANSVRDASLLNTTEAGVAVLRNMTGVGAGASPCTCLPGFWSPTGAVDVACVSCPLGGVCPGGLARPFAAPGFHPSETGQAGVFLPCPHQAACRGGTPFQCATGYTAHLCAECSTGYYKLGARCIKCESHTIAILVALVVVTFVVAACLIWFNAQPAISYRFAAAMIGLNALQISAIYGRLNLKWGSFARTWLDVVSFINLNVELSSPECAVNDADAFMLKWWVTMMLPLVAVLVFGAVFCVMVVVVTRTSLWNVTPGTLRSAAVRGYNQGLVLLYLPLTAGVLSYFGCRKERDGTWVLTVAPARACYNAAYWAVFPCAVFFFFLYCVCIPMGILGVLVKRRRAMDALSFELRYAFLVARFHERFFHFDVSIMARKLGVVLCMTFFTDSLTAATAAVLVLMGSLIQLAVWLPYRSSLHNAMAVFVLTCVVVVLLSGTVEDDNFRTTGVISGLVLNTLAIVVGNAADVWLIMRSEKEAEAEFDAAMAEPFAVYDDDGEDKGAIQMGDVVFVGAAESLTATPTELTSTDLSMEVLPVSVNSWNSLSQGDATSAPLVALPTAPPPPQKQQQPAALPPPPPQQPAAAPPPPQQQPAAAPLPPPQQQQRPALPPPLPAKAP